MAWYRLTKNHEVSLKLKELWAKMQELGLRIEIGHYGRLRVICEERPYDLLDLENPPNCDRYHPTSLPPEMECKLVYERESEK